MAAAPMAGWAETSRVMASLARASSVLKTKPSVIAASQISGTTRNRTVEAEYLTANQAYTAARARAVIVSAATRSPSVKLGGEGGAVDEAREQDQRQEDLADPAHPLGDMVRVLPMQRPRPTEEDERDEQLHIGLHVVGNVGKREQQKAENPDEGQ